MPKPKPRAIFPNSGTLLTSWNYSIIGLSRRLRNQDMPRQARLDSPGTLHHVMTRGIERRNIVDEEQDRKDFVRRLGKLASETFTAMRVNWCKTTG
jgi:hypothetical protein